MKKILLFFTFTMILFAEEVDLFPKIEKVKGVKPWWINDISPVEGMIGGVGIVPKGFYKDDQGKLRGAAMEGARREIATAKNTFVESRIDLKQNKDNTDLNVNSTQYTSGEVKALLIDTWEDEDSYYVWMGEFLDRVSYENLKVYINKKNVDTIENKINLIKYEGRIIVTNRDGGMITINAGSDKGVKVNEVYYIYRLSDESVNPLSNQVEDFTKEKIGEITIKEVFKKSSRGQASFMSNFKIQKGDIAYSAGYSQSEKEEQKQLAKEEKMKKYDYDLEYVPKVLEVERAKTLSTRQYSLSASTDFNSSKFDARIGLFRFFEASLNYNFNEKNYFDFLGKVGFPINRDTLIGLAYEKNWGNDVEYLIGLVEYQFAEGYGIANLNYKNPLGSVSEADYIGGALQLQPSSGVILGTEYGRKLENNATSNFTIKINLEVMDEIWFGAGVSWENERMYFIKIEHLNLI